MVLIRHSHFRVRIVAPQKLRPLHAVRYKLNWSRSTTVVSAHLTGSARRQCCRRTKRR
jgi:hypothetical protein